MTSFIILTTIILSLIALLYIWEFHKSKIFQKHRDFFICAGITFIFAAYAFTNLGNFQSPQNYFQENRAVYINFGYYTDIRRIQFMTGRRENEIFRIEFSSDRIIWEYLYIETRGVFAWDFRNVIVRARYAGLIPVSYEVQLMEVGFRDAENNLVPVVSVNDEGMNLFDEQHMIPLQPRDYMHSMYFDEIFYSRAAYELMHGMKPNEITHPHLGKIIISRGIEIFGMTPFGWRFMSALAGTILLVFLYFFALAIFKSSFWAGFAAFIFAFDFMHFVQSRIGMLDVFVVLFIVGMYFFMYKYSRLNFFKDRLGKTLIPLFFSGIFTGLAIATKWSGLYGAVGIALIFFITIGKRYCEYKENPEEHKNFKKYLEITIVCCVGFFVIIPAVIYASSYIPRRVAGTMYPQLSFLHALVQVQIDKMNFHLFLNAEHPFSSYWWEWLINRRPVFYFGNTVSEGLVQGINSFGNPLIWWGGLPAFAYTIYKAFKKNFVPLFLVIGYLSMLIPWIVFSRTAFIWYYYPNVIFLVLMLTYAIKESGFKPRFACFFAGGVFVLFLLFYPVLSGVPVSADYVRRFLLWPFMGDWVLIQ